jgi:simple sugar transport system permease protein
MNRAGNWVGGLLMVLAAPVLALVLSGIIASVLLLATGYSVGDFWSILLTAPSERQVVNILNYGAILYLSGVAAAIGFRMNLFNIGVEGQYRIGAFAGAVFAGSGWLTGPLNTIVAILIAMVSAALWAGIAGFLRVTRAVSEVISTIMLNAIAGYLVGYFLRKLGEQSGNATSTKDVPESSWVGGIDILKGSGQELLGLSLFAVVVGVLYWLVLNKTVFGFNLRATGGSETAAVASGVDVKRMVVVSMLLSGAVAGLIGMPVLFGDAHNYGSSFQTGIGFAGIAVALLGRNNPVGIALGALIFSYLHEQANNLNILAGISPDIVQVTQGVIVLCVVVAYEVARRVRVRIEQASVAAALETRRSERTEVPA